VLIGGGHSHVFVLEAFGAAPAPKAEITLISRVAAAAYSGMLPGLIAGHYRFEQCHINLGTLCRFAKARFLLSEATALDLSDNTVSLSDGQRMPFDLLSIDIGSSPPVTQGIAADAILKVKPIESFLPEWEALQRAQASLPSSFIIVGGGAAGVEMTLAMQHKLEQTLGTRAANVRFQIVTDTPHILPSHSPSVRRMFKNILVERGIATYVEKSVAHADGHGVTFSDGRKLEGERVIWVTGAGADQWPRAAGLKTDSDGFIAVNDFLQSVSHPHVFAAGDIANQENHPRPKSGVFAVRQGPPLAVNLRRALGGEPLLPFVPQRRALALISTGDKFAVMSWGSLALEGHWVWRWKDRIDRRFVERFNRFG
jgi:selenide, water dikinase